MLSILLSWHAQYSYALGLTPHSNVMSLFHQLFVCKHWSREEFSLEASTFQQLFESLKGCIFNSENIQTSSKSLSQPQKSSVAWEIFFSPPHPQEKRKRTHSASSLWRFRRSQNKAPKSRRGWWWLASSLWLYQLGTVVASGHFPNFVSGAQEPS